jgi:hypothetical protein
MDTAPARLDELGVGRPEAIGSLDGPIGLEAASLSIATGVKWSNDL